MNRRCYQCKYFTSKSRDSTWKKEHRNRIGICDRYCVDVLDSLCGCTETESENRKIVYLHNFDPDDLAKLPISKGITDYTTEEPLHELERRCKVGRRKKF